MVQPEKRHVRPVRTLIRLGSLIGICYSHEVTKHVHKQLSHVLPILDARPAQEGANMFTLCIVEVP